MPHVLDQLLKSAPSRLNAAPRPPRPPRDDARASFEKSLADARPRKSESPQPHEIKKVDSKPVDPAPDEAVETSAEKPQAQTEKPAETDAPADDQAAVATDEQESPQTKSDTDTDSDDPNAQAEAQALLASLQVQPNPQTQPSSAADDAPAEGSESTGAVEGVALGAEKLQAKPLAAPKETDADAESDAKTTGAAPALLQGEIALPQNLADDDDAQQQQEEHPDDAAEVIQQVEKLARAADTKPADAAAPAPERPAVEKHAPKTAGAAETADATAMAQAELPPDGQPIDRAAAAPAATKTDATDATINAVQPRTSPQPSHAPAAPPAAPPIPREVEFADNNHERIVSSVKGQLLPSGGTMRIRLDPPEMGALQVTVRMVDGVMNASFETNNDQATKLLSHSLGQLKQSLESQGVSVEKLHVQQSPKDQQSDSNPDDRRQSSDPNGQSARQEQQRKEMLNRMWRRLRIGSDPLDMVA
jgi:flagellar hook-length control protein FliK